MKYTDGDWLLNDNDGVIRCGHKEICEIPSDSEEDIGNAKLMIASPKMFKLLSYMAKYGWSAGVQDEAEEIIIGMQKSIS